MNEKNVLYIRSIIGRCPCNLYDNSVQINKLGAVSRFPLQSFLQKGFSLQW